MGQLSIRMSTDQNNQKGKGECKSKSKRTNNRTLIIHSCIGCRTWDFYNGFSKHTNEFPGHIALVHSNCNPNCPQCVQRFESPGIMNPNEILVSMGRANDLSEEREEQKASEPIAAKESDCSDCSDSDCSDDIESDEKAAIEKERNQGAMKRLIQGSRDGSDKDHYSNSHDFREPWQIAIYPHLGGCIYCARKPRKYKKYWKYGARICDGCPASLYNCMIGIKKQEPGYCLYSKSCPGCLERKSLMLCVVDVI